MIQRFYIDTSVIGGVFDHEFQEHSIILFERIKLGQIKAVYSEITENELFKAPTEIKDFFNSIPSQHTEFVELTPEIVQLADAYITENVVGKTSRDDCLHIAAATITKADILLSWNFKHIVNVYRIRGYNSVNLKFGYPILEIRSPKEIVDYEH